MALQCILVGGNSSSTATKLATSVSIQTNLASTTAASFDGTSDILPGITGILGIANGGTGTTTGHIAITTASDGTEDKELITYDSEALLTEDSVQLLATVSDGTNTTSTASPAHGGTFTAIDSITRDDLGHIMKVNTKTITLPTLTSTGTQVTNTLATTTKAYLTGTTSSATTNTGTQIFDTGVYLSVNEGELVATSFVGDGSQLTNISADNISSGTLSAARLSSSGVTAGSYGLSADATPAHAGTFSVPYLTVDAYGRVTAASTKTVTLPAEADLTSLDASNITSGTLAAARLPASGVTTGNYGPAASASPAHGGSFVVPYFVVDTYGRITSAAARTITLPTLDASGVTAGSYGLSAATSPAHGGSFNVPYVTVDSYGHVTAAATNKVTLPEDGVTNNDLLTYDSETLLTDDGETIIASTYSTSRVTQTLTSTSANYPILLAPSNQTRTTITTSYFGTKCYVNPSSGTIYANYFQGNGSKLTGINAAAITGTLSTSILETSGVQEGDYGPNADASPSHGGTITVPYFSVDEYGRIVEASDRTVTLPTATDTKVYQALLDESSTSTTQYPLILGAGKQTTSTTGAVYFATTLQAAPGTGTIYANYFDGDGSALTNITALKTSYGTCDSLSTTVDKVVTCDNDFSLVTGARIVVLFTYQNNADSPTLNVNSTGAYAIGGKYYSDSTHSNFLTNTKNWNANSLVEFVFTGTYWIILSIGSEGYATKATGALSHAEGFSTEASGSYAHAEGGNTVASVTYSHAEGHGTTASGYCSHAEGCYATVSGAYSHAEGYYTTVSDYYSHAEGYYTTASGGFSHAGGVCTTALELNTAIGKYNTESTTTASITATTGDAFIIGNGTDSDSLSNAFRVTYAGKAYGLSSFGSSGADYAEFIKEWADGNEDSEDRVGYFVTIKNGYLEKAQSGDYIAGITSGNPSIVGNSDENYYWKYERDEFNRFVYEDAPIYEEQIDDDGNLTMVDTGEVIENGKLKLSDSYDSTQVYIERAARPEWDYVGMIGVLPVRDDGTCIAGSYCCCNDEGIATLAETRGTDTFFVIERISDNVISVLLK